MRQLQSSAILSQPARPNIGETPAGVEPLEVNVIFADRKATVAALKTAESLARDLGASIRLRATVAVPVRLALEESPVSIPFMEQLLRDVVDQAQVEPSEVTVHLYVCRDGVEALAKELRPKSICVVGGREHWWPTAPSRVAGALRARGHRVVVVNPTVRVAESVR